GPLETGERPVAAVDLQQVVRTGIELAADELASAELGVEEAAPDERAAQERGVRVAGRVESHAADVQSVKAAPTPPASVMSTSTNRTFAWFSLVRSRESQFADEMVVSVGAAGRPCTDSAMRPSMAYGTSAAH